MMPVPEMSLSIIVPCLNEAAYIRQSLQALAPCRARGAEVIVVDGGSTDGSAGLAQPLADRVLCAPRGRACQMNAGAAVARGDILLFMHVDCRLPQAADDLMSSGLRTGGFQWGRFDVAIEGGNALLRTIASAMNRRSRWTGIATGDQGIFVTRSAFDAVGGYPPLALMEDIELSARLKRVSHPLCIAEPIMTSGRRWEKHGVLRTIVLMWFLRLAYWLGVDTGRLARLYAPHRPDTRVLVFAKAPQPGSVKTRLIPVLGEKGAAALHEALVKRALTTATRAYRDRVTLCCAPDTNHPFFHACTALYGVTLVPQVNGDLGDRMRYAFEQALQDSASVILIGSDCPTLTADDLLEAGRLLHEGCNAVFAPAEDGGYGLVALKRRAAPLFENIAWGERTVMEETRTRLRQLAWSWCELATVWDVDRPADYERLVASGLLGESTAFTQQD